MLGKWTLCPCAYKFMSLNVKQRNVTCFISSELYLLNLSTRNHLIPDIPKHFLQHTEFYL